MKTLSTENKMTLLTIGAFIVVLVLTIESCSVSQKVSNKTGSQLWAENCQHCHNTPSPTSFSGNQWVTIGMHMQTRALITEQERDKIVEFLQQTAK